MTSHSEVFDQVMSQPVGHHLVRGFQTIWDNDSRQTHFAHCSNGTVLKCADIAYPRHCSSFGVDGNWVATDMKAEDLRGLEFIGYYAKPTLSA
ncbi:hypothetical protein RYA05_04515 [Pseudomonas syringae pv. actinidiae]|nr:hypothetical protein [Pseudomonas syringae pv. actinidiae]